LSFDPFAVAVVAAPRTATDQPTTRHAHRFGDEERRINKNGDRGRSMLA
jgi:hypothetical protein